MKIKCYVIDDEPLAVKLLEGYVEKTPFLQLEGSSISALQALEEITSKEIDILFLDIEMPEINGIEFCKMLPKEVKVIFTTAYTQFAVESYRVNALDYLLKPVSYQLFLSAVNKYVAGMTDHEKQVEESPMTSIFVKSASKLQRIKIDDILYIEGLKDYVKIHIADNQPSVVSLMSMKSINEMLSKNNFMRVHRSYIVNLNNVTLLERNRIVFGKERIPVSDMYREEFMNKLSELNIMQKG